VTENQRPLRASELVERAVSPGAADPPITQMHERPGKPRARRHDRRGCTKQPMNDYIRVRVCLAVVDDGRLLLVPHYNTDAGPVQ
jgi:hypothetical protein